MIDLKVDLNAVRQAKELKSAMVQRLKQIDFDNSGLITLDSLITISEKYGIHLSQADLALIKDKYRKTPTQVQQALKVDYDRVLNDIKLRIDHDGKVQWVLSAAGNGRDSMSGRDVPASSPYRIKISKITQGGYSHGDDVLSIMSGNQLSPPNQMNGGGASATSSKKDSRFSSNIRLKTQRENVLSKAGFKAISKEDNDIDLILMSPQPLDMDRSYLSQTMTRDPTPTAQQRKAQRLFSTESHLPEIQKPVKTGGHTPLIHIDPIHSAYFNLDHVSHKIVPEIKRLFKEYNLELKMLLQMKHEFQKRDIYAFSFANDKELKFFIENIGITVLPEQLVKYMYYAITNPATKKINYTLLKQFIDVCQDSYISSDQARAREIKEIMEGAGLEDDPRHPGVPSKGSNQPLTEASLSLLDTQVSSLQTNIPRIGFTFPLELQPWVKEIETWINNRFFTLRDAFRSFDIEKQGDITESKFLEGIIQMNLPHITEDVIRAVFKALDQDHNGRINFEEFCYLNQRRRLNNNSPAPPQGGQIQQKQNDQKSVHSMMTYGFLSSIISLLNSGRGYKLCSFNHQSLQYIGNNHLICKNKYFMRL